MLSYGHAIASHHNSSQMRSYGDAITNHHKSRCRKTGKTDQKIAVISNTYFWNQHAIKNGWVKWQKFVSIIFWVIALFVMISSSAVYSLSTGANNNMVRASSIQNISGNNMHFRKIQKRHELRGLNSQFCWYAFLKQCLIYLLKNLNFPKMCNQKP